MMATKPALNVFLMLRAAITPISLERLLLNILKYDIDLSFLHLIKSLEGYEYIPTYDTGSWHFGRGNPIHDVTRLTSSVLQVNNNDLYIIGVNCQRFKQSTLRVSWRRPPSVTRKIFDWSIFVELFCLVIKVARHGRVDEFDCSLSNTQCLRSNYKMDIARLEN